MEPGAAGGAAGEEGSAGRFPLLFCVNTLLSNGVSAALGGVGASLGWGANAYYWAASVMLGALALATPAILRASDGIGGAIQRLQEED